MVKLSVNLNKIALVRNSRGEGIPDLKHFAELVLNSEAVGITLHPRPDARHVTSSDVLQISKLISTHHANKELNLEGNPFTRPNKDYLGFLNIVEKALPHQVTLVPDQNHQLTSYYGWDLKENFTKLQKVVERLKKKNIRVSLFLDHKVKNLSLAKKLGADRIEIHTGYFAKNFSTKNQEKALLGYEKIAEKAKSLNLGLNAGHDLNLANLALFLKQVRGVQEVSIGHALVAESLARGFSRVLGDYLKLIKEVESGGNGGSGLGMS